MTELLSQIGAKTEFSSNGVLCIDPSGINNVCVTFDMVNSLRASYYLLERCSGDTDTPRSRSREAVPLARDLSINTLRDLKRLEPKLK